MRGWFWGVLLVNSLMAFPAATEDTPDKLLTATGEIYNSDGTKWSNGPSEPTQYPRLSADGTQIVFEFGWNIWVSNRDGSERRALTQGRDFRDRSPDWSPDGTRIVFSRVTEDLEAEGLIYFKIYVMDADGSNSTLIADVGYHAERPVWSPDGQRIAFDAADTSLWDEGIDSRAIFLVNPDGSDLTKLTEYRDRGAYQPAWSPDGTRLAFHDVGEERGVYLIDRDGQNVVQVISGQGTYLCWSPDGTQLAYFSERNNKGGLYVNNLSGTNERLLLSGFSVCQDWFIAPQATALPFQSWGRIKHSKK